MRRFGLEISVGLVMLAAVIGLFVVAFGEGPNDIDYSPPQTTPTTPTTPDPRFTAGVLQAQATENSGIRSRQVAAIVAAGAAFSLYLTFLNLTRESRRDAHERAVKESERTSSQTQIANERFARAIEHLKPENSTAVRTAGIKALEMLANEPQGPREEVRAVLVELGNEQSSQPPGQTITVSVPGDIRAAREASERLQPRIYLDWDEEDPHCLEAAAAIEIVLTQRFPLIDVSGPAWLASQRPQTPAARESLLNSVLLGSRAAIVVAPTPEDLERLSEDPDDVLGLERVTQVALTALREDESTAQKLAFEILRKAARLMERTVYESDVGVIELGRRLRAIGAAGL